MVMEIYLRSIMILTGTLEDDRFLLHFIYKAEILYRLGCRGNDEKKSVRNKQSQNMYFLSVTHRLTYGKYVNCGKDFSIHKQHQFPILHMEYQEYGARTWIFRFDT